MKLKKWMNRNEMRYRDMANDLGLHYSYLYKLANGDRVPSLVVAIMIEEYTDGQVEVSSWMD